MYYSKKVAEPVPEQQTSVWMCSNDDCTCWQRENFSFTDNPLCPLCQSSMVRDTKMLPALYNGFHK